MRPFWLCSKAMHVKERSNGKKGKKREGEREGLKLIFEISSQEKRNSEEIARILFSKYAVKCLKALCVCYKQ